ncbi:uncharacterized protein V6R79_017605 [Siganus canaliculatus]
MQLWGPDKTTATVCLWWEAAVAVFNIGQHLRISHVKVKDSDSFGFSLNSTNFTNVQKMKCMFTNVEIVGVVEHDEQSFQILMADGQDLKVTTVCLWREAAIFSLNVGEAVSITHLKPKSADHGWFLQSTAFTKVEKTKKVLNEVTIIGVTEGKDAGTMQVLVADGQVFIVSATLWELFEQFLQTDIITVNLEVEGNAIQRISTINLEE